jgi:transcriptional regulator with XRE-family HTH domain
MTNEMNSYSALKSRSKDRLSYWLESAKQDFMVSIHAIMLREKISNAALAEKIGCSPAYISKILKGDANFTIETMVKISRALDSKLCIHLSAIHDDIKWMGVVKKKRAPAIDEKHLWGWAGAGDQQVLTYKVAVHG